MGFKIIYISSIDPLNTNFYINVKKKYKCIDLKPLLGKRKCFQFGCAFLPIESSWVLM